MPSTYRLQFLLEARVRVEAREMDLAVGREEVEGRGGEKKEKQSNDSEGLSAHVGRDIGATRCLCQSQRPYPLAGFGIACIFQRLAKTVSVR